MEIVLIFCCIRNYFRARAAKLNAALWSFYTFLAILIAFFIASIIAVIILLLQDPHLQNLMTQQPTNKQAIMDYMMSKNLTFANLFIAFSGLGGYLFTRHLIIKKTIIEDESNNVG